MNPSAIYSKSGKGVQEASGKTSLLKRQDRAVLSAIDGRATLAEVAVKVGKSFDPAFEALVSQLDKEGFIREVTLGASSTSQSRSTISQSRPTIAPPKAAPPKAPAAKAPPPPSEGEDLDFTSIMPPVKPAASPPPAPPPPVKPAASPPPASPPPAVQQRAKEQESTLYKARQEAEARAQAERHRLRLEVEAKARAETEAKIRAETERKVREEAEAKVKAEAEAKAKAVRDMAMRLAAQAKAKAEAEATAKIELERRAREEVERRAKEEAEKARREAEELRQRLEEERKAREAEERKRRVDEERRRKEEEERRAGEEAERKAREAEERKRREDEERRRKEEEERRADEEAERQAREADERKRREDEERRRSEEAERRVREEIEAKARVAAEATRRAEEDRHLREKEAQGRKAREEDEARARREREQAEAEATMRAIEEEAARARKAQEATRNRQPTLQSAPEPPPPPEPAVPAKGGAGSLDALMADLDSFSNREEEERQTREAAEHEVRAEKKRKQKEDSERRARERAAEEDREIQRVAEERERREEEERRAQEEAERRVREAEEQRRVEAEERKRRAREVLATRKPQASVAKEAGGGNGLPDDIGVTDDDLDMSEVRKDEAAVAKDSREAQREREREARLREREARERAQAAAREEPVKYSKRRRPISWGKPVAITLFILLLAGIAALHLMPIPMTEYEQAASASLGRTVKIESARLSLFTGVRVNLTGVTIGNSAKIPSLHAYPKIGSLLAEEKVFSRIELESASIEQQAIFGTLLVRAKGDKIRIQRIFVKHLKLPGPVALPTFEAEALIGLDGRLRNVTLRGPESLNVKLTPAGSGFEFDVTAASLALPFAPDVTFESFAMKGIANSQGMNIAAWGGSVLDGALSGTANVRWSQNWHIDGALTVRNLNAAAFAPALVAEGKAQATGRFTMNAAEPARLGKALRLEGDFTVGKGMLGTFDLPRAIQSAGSQYTGRTQFTELTGQGVYERGAVTVRNVSMSAGALGASASADIAPGGALNGRIVAEVKTAAQVLRATLILGGTVREPQVRN